MPPQPQTVQPQPQGLMRGIGALGSMHNLKRGTRESSLMLMGKNYIYFVPLICSFNNSIPMPTSGLHAIILC